MNQETANYIMQRMSKYLDNSQMIKLKFKTYTLYIYFNLFFILRHASVCMIQCLENGICISPRKSLLHQ